MFHKTVPKGQKPDNTPYTIYNPHTLDLNTRQWTQGYYRVVCVDPGIRNLGFRIEDRHIDGRITMVKFVRKTLNIDKKADEVQCEVYKILTDFLDQFLSLFMTSHIIIVERQMHINYKCVRISQHIFTYFMLHLRDAPLLPIIMEVSSRLKTQKLKAPGGIVDKQVKAWAIDKANELLKKRGDEESLDIMNNERNHLSKAKRDDLADTVCYIEAVFIELGLKPLTQ